MNYKFLISSLYFSLFAFLLQAQTIKTYSGPYENGSATYLYYEGHNGERIYHGLFTYKNREGNLKIDGAYKNGKRNGKWLCTFTNYFYIVMTMSGTIQTNYINGNREGIWTYSISKNVAKFDVSGKQTETGKIAFKNNVPSGEYFYSSIYNVNTNAGKKETYTKIRGSFDENGYKTGEWNVKKIINNLPTEELKKYKKGYCYWYISRISSTGEITSKFDSTEYATNYFKNNDEVFNRDNIKFSLSKPIGSEIEGFYEHYTGDKGINLLIDNTGERYTIQQYFENKPNVSTGLNKQSNLDTDNSNNLINNKINKENINSDSNKETNLDTNNPNNLTDNKISNGTITSRPRVFGERKIIKYYSFTDELEKATIFALVKVTPDGTGRFIGFAKNSTSTNQVYSNTIINQLKDIKFDEADHESTVTVQFDFNVK